MLHNAVVSIIVLIITVTYCSCLYHCIVNQFYSLYLTGCQRPQKKLTQKSHQTCDLNHRYFHHLLAAVLGVPGLPDCAQDHRAGSLAGKVNY